MEVISAEWFHLARPIFSEAWLVSYSSPCRLVMTCIRSAGSRRETAGTVQATEIT